MHDFYILRYRDNEASDIQYIGDKYLSDLTISADKIGRISWKILTASKIKMQDSKCKGPFLPIDKKEKCYMNENHGFKVKTKQETKIAIKQLSSITHNGNRIICEYE